MLISIFSAVFFVFFPSLFFSLVLQRRIEYFLAATLPVFALLLYVSGLAGCLLPGFYLVCFICFAAAIGSLIIGIKSAEKSGREFLWERIHKNILTPGLFLFLLWVLVAAFVSWGRVLYEWDEFSHWGRIIKIIHANNTLPVCDPESLKLIAYKTYPVATALIGYLFTKGINFYVFTESACIFSAQLIFISIFPLLLLPSRRFELHKILLAFVFSFLCCFYWRECFLTTLSVDHFLGIVWGGCFLFLIEKEHFDWLHSILLWILLAFLILIKASGTGLAAMVMLFALSRGIYMSVKYKKVDLSILARYILPLTAFVFAIIHKISTAGIAPVFSSKKITFSGIINNLLLYPDQSVQYIRCKFIERLCKDRTYGVTGPLSYLGFVILFLLLIYIINHNSNHKKKFFIFCIYLFLCFIAYSFTLLVYYVFSFSAHEAAGLASFGRYISTFMICLSFLFFFFLLKLRIKKRYFFMLFILFVFLVPFCSFKKAVLDYVTPSHWPIKEQIILKSIVEQYRTEKQKFFVISDENFWCIHHAGVFFHGENYYNAGFFSFGAPRYCKLIYQEICPFSNEKMLHLCRNTDYCFVYKTNDFLKKNYARYFNDRLSEDCALYHCEKDSFQRLPLKEFFFEFSKVNLLDVSECINANTLFITKLKTLLLLLKKNGKISLTPYPLIPIENGKAQRITLNFGYISSPVECSVYVNDKCLEKINLTPEMRTCSVYLTNYRMKKLNITIGAKGKASLVFLKNAKITY